jgi:hypothetical protein
MIRIIKADKFSKKELKLGRPIEMEHTKSKKTALRIAKQHLKEFPNYYSKGLIPMEKKLKKNKK